MKKKILSLLLALVMALSLVPTSVLAAPVDLGKAHVIVENTTFTKPVDGKAPAWTGTLVDTWVKLTEDSTMMGCAKGDTHTGTTYIGEINGLSEFDGGGQSGWMGTLNDWFANEGFAAFTVAAGKLEAGDEIRVTARIERRMGNFFFAAAEAHVGDKLCVQGKLSFALLEG